MEQGSFSKAYNNRKDLFQQFIDYPTFYNQSTNFCIYLFNTYS